MSTRADEALRVAGAVSLMSLGLVDISTLGSVRGKRADALAQMGINSVLDLLTHYPRRYVDRTNHQSIAEAADGDDVVIMAKVRRVAGRRSRRGRSLTEADLFDGSSYLRLTFFNQPWRARQLKEGMEVIVFGQIDRYKGRRQMTNPVVDLVGDKTGRIVPIYPQSEKAGLASWQIAEHVEEALDRFGNLIDPLPPELRERLGLAGRSAALRDTHLPSTLGDKERGRRRLGFDELLRLQVILVQRKKRLESASLGFRHQVEGQLLDGFVAGLPFDLTSAQLAAVQAIKTDMSEPHPMHRLLQGDVGSGKTVVAVAGLLMAVQGGHQGAVMAPTEVLAEQHYAAIGDLLAGLTIPSADSLFGESQLRVRLLTNRITGAVRRRLLEDLKAGAVDILIGTHALLTENVEFGDLAAVVIDEQHRFGVEQRAVLRGKGPGERVPDVLVMTATPIPRTAAMTVFGDLDTTVLDELPPGRTPVTTVWARDPGAETEAWERVRSEAGAGRQAYVVCPLVEGSEKVQAKSAVAEHERLRQGVLAGLNVGLLHGQMLPADKESVMGQFRAGKVDVLVATTVIEVGVDVPRATVMIVEDAGRFGVAQLHQLRGRVGRGGDRSWCYLIGQGMTSDGGKRLEALEESTDGFHLAEVDLELRGEGTILGTRQKGATDLKLASLRRHKVTVAKAREVAFELLENDPELSALPELAEEIASLVNDDDSEFLFKN